MSAPLTDARAGVLETGGEGEVPSGAAGQGRPGEPATVRAYAWSAASGFEQFDSVDPALEQACARPDAYVWIDVENAGTEVLEALASWLGIHPLIAEDIIERNQRAKIELTGELVHLVVFALAHAGGVEQAEIDVVLGERFLLTSHAGDWRPELVGHFRRGNVDAYLREGPDYVLWAIVDSIVDGYFPVFDALGDEIDELQEEVLGRPSRWLIERLFQVRRDLLTIRHAVSPQREIFSQLTNREMPFVRAEHVIYFRDVYDHLIRLTEELDTYRELVGTTLDAYLTTVNNNLSEIMKRLTAATVILAGVGAVAGIFGMSEAALAFRFDEGIGFWVITAAILALALSAWVYFRRIGWV